MAKLKPFDSVEVPRNSEEDGPVTIPPSDDPVTSRRYAEMSGNGDHTSEEYLASKAAREQGVVDEKEKNWAVKGITDEKAAILAEYDARIAAAGTYQESLELITARQAFANRQGISDANIDNYIDSKYQEMLIDESIRNNSYDVPFDEITNTVDMAKYLSPAHLESLRQLSDETSVLDIGLIGNLVMALASGPREAYVYNSIVEALFPDEDIGGWGHFNPNKARDILAKRFVSATPQQKAAIATQLQVLLSSPENRDFYINDLEKYAIIEEFLSGQTVDPDSLSRTISDVISGLDILTLGQLGKIGLARPLLKSGRTTQHVANDAVTTMTANVKKAQEKTAASLLDNEAAAANGMGSSQVAGEVHLPVAATLDDTITMLPDASREAIRQSDEELAKVTQQGEYVLVQNYTEQEALEATRRVAAEVQGGRGTIVLAGSQKLIDYNLETGDIVYKTYIGARHNGGTFEMSRAVSIANRMKKDGIDAQVFKHEPTGRYLVEVQLKDNIGKNFLEGPMVSPGIFGTYSSLLNSSSALLSKFYQTMKSGAMGKGSALEKSAQRIVAPYAKLGKESRAKVDELLIAGSKNNVEYKAADLIGAVDPKTGKSLYTPDEIAGYISYRNLMRADHAIKERDWAIKLRSEGFTRYSTAGNLPLKVVNDFGANKTGKVLDTDTMKLVDAPDASALPNSHVLAELPDWFESGEQVTRYALVKRSNIVDLPEHSFMPARTGYLPVEYKGNYWLRRQIKQVVDGKELIISKPAAVFKNKKEAQAAYEEIVASGKGKTLLPPDYAKELQPVAQSARVIDLENSYFHARSNFHYSVDDDLLSTPTEILENVVSNKIPNYSINTTVRNLKERFMQQYKDNIRPGTKGFPDETDLVFHPGKPVEEAMAAWKQIQLYSSSATAFDRTTRRTYLKIAEQFEKLPAGSYVARTLGTAAQSNKWTVGNLTKRVAFNTQIALNPFAQFFIQGAHLMFVSSLDPAAAQKAFRAGYALAFTGQNKEIIKQATKMSGYTAEEMKVLKNLYDKSGLGVISNAVHVDDISENLVKGSLAKPVNAIVTTGQRLGFDNGEKLNRANMLVFAAERHSKQTGKKITQFTDKDLSDIHAMSLELGFNMTRSDIYSYQRGLFSAATQYWSVRQKAVMTALGQNKSLNLTGAEKTRLAAGQLMWFGTEGLGLTYMVNSMIDYLGPIEDEDLKHAINGGLTDLLVNQMLQSAWGGDPSVSVSQRISPMSDLDYSILALTALPFVDDKGTLIENFMGASYSPWSKFFRAADITLSSMSTKELATEAGMMDALRALSEVVPSIGNTMSKTMIEQGVAYQLNRFGKNPTAAHMWMQEMWAKRLFGTQTYGDRINHLSFAKVKDMQQAADDASHGFYVAYNNRIIDNDYEGARRVFMAAKVAIGNNEAAWTRFENKLTNPDDLLNIKRTKSIISTALKSDEDVDLNWTLRLLTERDADPVVQKYAEELKDYIEEKE